MLSQSATVREACQRMRDRRVGAVLVIDDYWVFSPDVTPFTVCSQREKAPPAQSWPMS